MDLCPTLTSSVNVNNLRGIISLKWGYEINKHHYRSGRDCLPNRSDVNNMEISNTGKYH